MPDLLGAHMSIAGGVYRALERGLEVGCSVVQIFLKNQLQWAAAPYSEEDIRRFRDAWKATRMRAVFAHSSYLINLAAPAEPRGSGPGRRSRAGPGARRASARPL